MYICIYVYIHIYIYMYIHDLTIAEHLVALYSANIRICAFICTATSAAFHIRATQGVLNKCLQACVLRENESVHSHACMSLSKVACASRV